MATTQFAFCAVPHLPPSAYAVNATFEVKTPSASSSQTTAAAGASQNMCRVATDAAIYVAFGSSPTASSTTGFFLPAGAAEYFFVSAGDKAAVITAP